ncbi:MAG TPA: tyrosine--tRNA ligase [Actinomycetota bacterium]|jgi:tyrosyl-tRNA synthetase|nr:tyrosine--tRNA ligase [Actinomycetota bacterium]
MSFPSDVAHHLRVLLSGVAEVTPADELERKLARSVSEGRPLRAKLGIDPSAPDLHLGHAVVLGALRRFQDLGHTAVLILGDFTGRVGDPTGQTETRRILTPEELEANAQTYLAQAGKILDVDRAEVRWNSEWLAALTFADVARLAGTLTVARLLERDDFSARFRDGRPISLSEFLYPLMQGYDSVAIQADVELGGTDQTFNLLVGRDVQRAHDQEPQVAFTMPILPGTDGDRKMSKSFGNHIGLTDPPEEQFGKTMSIPDDLIPTWVRLCTGVPPEDVDAIERGLAAGSLHPAEQKRRLAREIVTRYHGEGAARAAEDRFDRVFRSHEVPDDVSEVAFPEDAVRNGSVWIVRLLAGVGLAASNADARRLIEQGGVRIDGRPVTDPDVELPVSDVAGRVLQVGRRRFVRLVRDAARG